LLVFLVFVSVKLKRKPPFSFFFSAFEVYFVYYVFCSGAGESGKSTIAKQMKIIHKEGFSAEERATYKSIIFNNVISAMRSILSAADDLGIKIDAAVGAFYFVVFASPFSPFFYTKDSKTRLQSGGEEYFTGPISEEIGRDIKILWSDPGVKTTVDQAAKFQLIDSAH
jgi:hypothetical protein